METQTKAINKNFRDLNFNATKTVKHSDPFHAENKKKNPVWK